MDITLYLLFPRSFLVGLEVHFGDEHYPPYLDIYLGIIAFGIARKK